MKNPPWHRDELILALDLYFDIGTSGISRSHPKIIELSNLLNRLPLHQHRPDEMRFRNPNGVHMKLMNFRSVDPQYHGRGLPNGGKEDEIVWHEFVNERDALKTLAMAIRDMEGFPFSEKGEYSSAPEGQLLLRLHQFRERDKALVAKKKQLAKNRTGILECEVCGFVFTRKYGRLGEDFIECHHIVPLSQSKPELKTRLADLALVCANCHRMLHAKGGIITIDGLRRIVNELQANNEVH